MDWPEYAGARQMLMEERIGTRLRENKAIEDAQAKKALGRVTER
jgi:hypothetical protein